jgi:hypothetical protein
MILRRASAFKCANAPLFFFLLFDGFTHVSEHHFRDVAGGGTKDGNGLRCIEVIDVVKVLNAEIPIRVISGTR